MNAWLLLGVLALTPETIATSLIDDLRTGHAPQAHARLGATARGAISPDALLAAWQQVAGPLGAWQSTELTRTLQQNGMTVLIHTVRFAKGSVETTTAVDPKAEKAEGFFLKPLAPPSGTAPYVRAGAFTAIEVVVGKAPFALPGTLTVPQGKGPFPAVVLVHGSGPNDRDELVGANRPFKDLAEGLASRGVLVLRYDKRTLTHGKALVGKAITLDDEVIDDALLAVELLAARKDTGKLYVVGHSLGALLAPEISSRSKAVAGAVLLAPPARKPRDIILQQLKYVGAPAEKIAETEREFARLEGGDLQSVVLGAPGAYWNEWAKKDGIAAAKKLGKPVLVLRGARDYQVNEEDFAAWKAGLRGVPNTAVLSIEKANHLFIEGEGKSMPAEYAVPGHVSVDVITRIAAFVTAPVAGPKKKR